MRKTASIRTIIGMSLLVVLFFTILIVSTLFYRQFQNSLVDRVLLQLSSIRTLKKIQVEKILDDYWSKGTLAYSSNKRDGIYSLLDSTSQYKLEVVKDSKAQIYSLEEIQNVLLERTGMGQSGESYLVSKEYRLLSKSRFFPNTPPSEIKCKTFAAKEAFRGQEGTKIIQDYRGVKVFSAFDKIEVHGLEIAILSEIDEAEALLPLRSLERSLVIIILVTAFIGVITSLFLAQLISRPILRMNHFLKQMKEGNYHLKVQGNSVSYELTMMFTTLQELIDRITKTIAFSRSIGNMEFNTSFHLDDPLGQSLKDMRDKLKLFNEKEQERQKKQNAAVIFGQEKERGRLAKELHDGIGPMLTLLKMNLSKFDLDEKSKTEVFALIDETVNEVRRMTFNLMPQSLVDFGLEQAVQNFIFQQNKVSVTEIEFIYNSQKPNTRLPSEVETCCFRVVQELVNNGLKHGNAKKMSVELEVALQIVTIKYNDNGKGFDPRDHTPGNGLKNIRNRIDVLSGNIDIQSSKNGTAITIQIPH